MHRTATAAGATRVVSLDVIDQGRAGSERLARWTSPVPVPPSRQAPPCAPSSSQRPRPSSSPPTTSSCRARQGPRRRLPLRRLHLRRRRLPPVAAIHSPVAGSSAITASLPPPLCFIRVVLGFFLLSSSSAIPALFSALSSKVETDTTVWTSGHARRDSRSASGPSSFSSAAACSVAGAVDSGDIIGKHRGGVPVRTARCPPQLRRSPRLYLPVRLRRPLGLT